MRLDPTSSPKSAIDYDLLAIHLLKELTTLQRRGRRADLATLAERVGVRRADARTVLSRLHQQGFIDVLRMRVTLAGLAIGASLRGVTLAPLFAARRQPSKQQPRRQQPSQASQAA